MDSEARESERAAIIQPYSKSITYETEYDPNMTIESAYGYLKTLPEFEGAEDV